MTIAPPFRRQAMRTLTGLLSLSLGLAQAKEPPVHTTWLSKLALGGYDTVAYFTEGQPVKGDARWHWTYQGAEWRFASEAHLQRFQAQPERYAPQFGGYCAWAVAQGYTASGDPLQWRIVDERLYINYDAEVQRKWLTDIPGFIQKARQNWPAVLR